MINSPDLKTTNAELLAELQRLRESEQRYRMLAEISQDMIFVIDQQGIVEYANPYVVRRFSLSQEAVIGQKLVNLFPSQAAEHQWHNIARVLKTRQPMYFEEQTLLAGGMAWLSTWMAPILDEQGNAVAVMGVSRDISERKIIVKDLKQAKEYAEKLIQTANAIVVGLDVNGNIQVFNEAAEQITGYKAAEVTGKDWFELFVPRDRYPAVGDMFASFVSGEVVKRFENPLITKRGEERIVSWQNSAIYEDGAITGIISFGVDVTERRQAERVQTTLYQISEAAHEAQSLEELYRLIHAVVVDLMPTRNFYIALYDPVVDLIHFPYHSDERDAEWPPHRLDRSLTSYVMRTGKAMLLNSEEMAQLERLGEVEPIGSRPVDWLGVPLKTKDQSIGVMAVQSYDENRRLLEQHKDVLAFLSNQVAMAIERKQAETELVESEERYRNLVELSPDGVAIHQKGSLVFVNPAAIKIMGASRAEELLGTPISQIIHPECRLKVMNRVRESLQTGKPLPLLEEKFLRVDGTPVDVEVAATPMMFHGEQVMQVIVHDITRRKEQDESLRLANEGLEQAYNATLEGWSRALELREQETAGHSQRVVEMTLQLAQQLGIDEENWLDIRRGALLHDIGKMGVPDNILLKPGPLTDDEWVTMRQHPIYSHEMLKNIPYLAQAIDIPYLHHERWNGTGYPLGLKGNEIPLAARTFAVVDVFDALSSNRPYRPAWPEKEVRHYLRANAGALFDPQVVDAFLSLAM